VKQESGLKESSSNCTQKEKNLERERKKNEIARATKKKDSVDIGSCVATWVVKRRDKHLLCVIFWAVHPNARPANVTKKPPLCSRHETTRVRSVTSLMGYDEDSVFR
jgi:siroheme synthase (precorrin-2 oxidase/ferrochelatase)